MKTNPDLFGLLLYPPAQKYIINNIKIPAEFKKRGASYATIEYYTGSTGNIDINSVNILAQYPKDNSSHIMFSIEKDGEYNNNSLSEADLNIVLNLPQKMLIEDLRAYDQNWYDFFSVIEETKEELNIQLKIAVKEENYEEAHFLKMKLRKYN